MSTWVVESSGEEDKRHRGEVEEVTVASFEAGCARTNGRAREKSLVDSWEPWHAHARIRPG
jgi:hypothetical protein